MSERLGRELRALRWENNMTLAQVAEKTGIDKMVIQRAETAVRSLRVCDLKKLAKVYGTTVSAIMEKVGA